MIKYSQVLVRDYGASAYVIPELTSVEFNTCLLLFSSLDAHDIFEDYEDNKDACDALLASVIAKLHSAIP